MADPATAEVLREKPPGPPPPVEEAPKTPSLSEWFMEQSSKLQERSDALTKAETDLAQRRAEGLRPAREALAQVAAGGPTMEPPTPPVEPTPPSPRLRPFAEGLPGESNVQVLNRTLMGLGLMAQMAVGVSKGFAQGALASYSGALEGWSLGDQERAKREWFNYLEQVRAMQRQYQQRRQAYEDTREKYKWDLDRAKTNLMIQAAEFDDQGMMLGIQSKGVDRSFNHLKMIGSSLEMMQRDAQNLSLRLLLAKGQDNTRREIAANHDATLRSIAAEREKDRQAMRLEKPVNAPAGGAFFDTKTGDFLSTVGQSELMKEPKRFTKLSQADQQLVGFANHGQQIVDRLALLAPRVLSQFPVQNILRAFELSAERRAALSPDLREFLNLTEEANVEGTRILGGGGQLRITLMKVLREHVGAKTSDTVATGLRTINTFRNSLDNRRISILDPNQKLPKFRTAPQAGVWQAYNIKTGKMHRIEVGLHEPIPEDFELVGQE